MKAPDELSPDWAWQPYEPAAGQWERRRAAHLYRRAAFGATDAELDAAITLGPAAAFHRLVNGEGEAVALENFDAAAGRLGQAVMAAGKTENLGAWWLYRMGKTPRPLLEQMALFWHGHFATSAAKVESAQLMRGQDLLFHRFALGSVAELTQAIAKDPAMLIWLDSQTNRKSRPNENFARELMELFCLGPGNYTEEDIRELARCFTGWEVRHDTFHFNPYQHDERPKRLLGRSGEFGGEEAVRIVLDQEAAPLFIVRKLARHLIAEEPELPVRLLAPLAAQLRDEEFVVRGVVERMLCSNLFYSDQALGRKVRSPVALGIGLLRCLGATTDYVQLNQELGRLGQALYFPPNVKGWDGGRSWIHSAALLGRANLVGRLVRGKETRFEAGSLEAMARAAGVTGGDETIDWLAELLLAVPLEKTARQALARTAEVEEGRVARLLHALAWLPEFQLA